MLTIGEFHFNGAITLKEYIEKDSDLERRFKKELVQESRVLNTISILRGIKERLEFHQGITIQNNAIIFSVALKIDQIKIEQIALKKESNPSSIKRLETLSTELRNALEKPKKLRFIWNIVKKEIQDISKLKKIGGC